MGENITTLDVVDHGIEIGGVDFGLVDYVVVKTVTADDLLSDFGTVISSSYDYTLFSFITESGIKFDTKSYSITQSPSEKKYLITAKDLRGPVTVDLNYGELVSSGMKELQELGIPHCFGGMPPKPLHQFYSHYKEVSASPLTSLMKAIPHGDEVVLECPVDGCLTEETVWYAVIHLNDHHKWTREQIADWLDSLDEDFSFQTGENNEHQD